MASGQPLKIVQRLMPHPVFYIEAMIHYLENKVGVVDFANAQGMVIFESPRARQGPRALKFYHSAGFCKIYYSHFIFEVMTFLRKIQN